MEVGVGDRPEGRGGGDGGEGRESFKEGLMTAMATGVSEACWPTKAGNERGQQLGSPDRTTTRTRIP